MERKTSFHTEEVKEALVAFANSLPENQEAVLFIGVTPEGKHVGVENADKCQMNVSKLAKDSCYPPVPCTPTVLKYEGVEVVAAVVQHSKQRPHFVGHAFIRVGSETKKASPEMMEELIASRTDKARRILKEKGNLISTVWRRKTYQPPARAVVNRLRTNSTNEQKATLVGPWDAEDKRECRIEHCDSHVVRLHEISTGCNFSASLENVKIDHDDMKNRMKLVIDNR